MSYSNILPHPPLFISVDISNLYCILKWCQSFIVVKSVKCRIMEWQHSCWRFERVTLFTLAWAWLSFLMVVPHDTTRQMTGWGDSGGQVLSIHGGWPVKTSSYPPAANCPYVPLSPPWSLSLQLCWTIFLIIKCFYSSKMSIKMAKIWILSFQIHGKSITSRFWLSAKLQMVIRETRPSVPQDVCVSIGVNHPFPKTALLQQTQTFMWKSCQHTSLRWIISLCFHSFSLVFWWWSCTI